MGRMSLVLIDINRAEVYWMRALPLKLTNVLYVYIPMQNIP